jgi:hypothetical protein
VSSFIVQVVHATLEESIFYPAALDALGNPGLIERAEQDHAEAGTMFEQLLVMDPSDDLYVASVQQLQDAVELHVQEQEEELFPQVRGSNMDMLEIGLQMADRRDELFSQLEDADAED